MLDQETNKTVFHDTYQKSVTVIGAGISGLRAAGILHKEGFQVKLLEASDYIGGRLKTNRSLSNYAFDEGGCWIHTPIGNPLTEMAQKLGVETVVTDDNWIIVYDENGEKIPNEKFEREKEHFNSVLKNVSRFGEVGTSFEHIYKREYAEDMSLIQQFLFSTYLTSETGDLNQLSSKYYDIEESFEGTDTIVKDGYDLLISYLAEGLDIELDQRVRSIDYTAAKVRVKTDTKEYTSDYVIVTVPLGVLKKGSISFTPSLPKGKQEAIKKIGVNQVNKFFVEWEKSFWDPTQFIGYTNAEKHKFNYFLNVKIVKPTVNGLITFAFGKEASRLENKEDHEVIEEIMKSLRVMYGYNIPMPKNILRSKWVHNENTFGSYSYASLETRPEDFDRMAKSIDGKLFFAGEHTIKEYFSSVHGAYLSGFREANKILSLTKGK
ncbi:FAD-dependent oxidoreductase [Alkalihalophilus lindianensis]|uniref:FAD-dependent oxidoreductase n=1 Tax=Alkalihalophilus lindianensis TaxID=1630542 RepID=A0ABU3XDV5_9BACI|nr:FAD-dependent oxidoreductase [Alkalihalophilus lindianensis]MDV2686067.1 FAD-dependent oxidoreductase [Alkalihalophilus lindianensis]